MLRPEIETIHECDMFLHAVALARLASASGSLDDRPGAVLLSLFSRQVRALFARPSQTWKVSAPRRASESCRSEESREVERSLEA